MPKRQKVLYLQKKKIFLKFHSTLLRMHAEDHTYIG